MSEEDHGFLPRKGSRPNGRDDHIDRSLTCAVVPESRASITPLALDPSREAIRFSRWHQGRKLFLDGLWRLCITILLCGGFAGILLIYQSYKIFGDNKRHLLNAATTGLSISLGLNFFGALKRYAQSMRWTSLSWRYHTLEEVELILGSDSQWNILRLLWVGRTKLCKLICVLWILTNIGAQILVAVIGLTYSATWNLDDIGVIHHANVSIVDLSEISYPGGPKGLTDAEQRGNAQAYGIQSEAFDVVPEDGSDVDGFASWQYTFMDMNPVEGSFRASKDGGNAFRISDRSISTSATCEALTVVPGSTLGNTVIDLTNGTDTSDFDVFETSPGSVTYVAQLSPTCGDRCIYIYAYQASNGGDSSIPKSSFFACATEITQVSPLPKAAYALPDETALWVAGSIGFSGVNRTDEMYDYQLYALSTPWSPDIPLDVNSVANLISQFSIGVIAAMDDAGPRINVTNGNDPVLESELDVEWEFAAPLLGALPVIQLIFLTVVVFIANRAVVHADGTVRMARLVLPALVPIDQQAAQRDSTARSSPNPELMGKRDPVVRPRVHSRFHVNGRLVEKLRTEGTDERLFVYSWVEDEASQERVLTFIEKGGGDGIQDVRKPFEEGYYYR